MDAALLGTGVAAGCLAAATAFGLWRRRRDGRLRPVPGAAGPATAVTPTGEPAPDRASRADSGDVPAELLVSLGVQPGAQATLLQFSSAFCAPCRVARRVCAEAARLLDGLQHVEVDAESHLEAVRALGIWRTPTVLVLDGAGRVVQRATGAPTMAQIVAVVGPLLAAQARA